MKGNAMVSADHQNFDPARSCVMRKIETSAAIASTMQASTTNVA